MDGGCAAPERRDGCQAFGAKLENTLPTVVKSTTVLLYNHSLLLMSTFTIEAVRLPHLQDHPLQVGLFKNVANAQFLRQQLLEGNAEYEYAFLDATVLISRAHVFAACFRAINDQLNNRLKTKNVHSEIVFDLSPNNNIAESFRRFGISDTTKHVVAIKVGGDAAQIRAFLEKNIEGEPAALSDESLRSLGDLARIRKIYRLEAPKKGQAELGLGQGAESFVLGSLALKGS
ncbi:EKC/KEOPS complex subunit [Acrodontium crateriforme]|uniref:EKC/KEOPS complex subunit CGI121 n=1 Tax=Acrodontium crateriforme TaxID=150365 RepID=A0AAQ3R8F6_9PEZI|nr:EKC/KEOPS complex subunit [Acrodontium crateriforme]